MDYINTIDMGKIILYHIHIYHVGVYKKEEFNMKIDVTNKAREELRNVLSAKGVQDHPFRVYVAAFG
jgi:hypothetical protein